MTIKFQADNDLNQIIVSAVKRREAEVDFQTAYAAGLHGLSDPEVSCRVLSMSFLRFQKSSDNLHNSFR